MNLVTPNIIIIAGNKILIKVNIYPKFTSIFIEDKQTTNQNYSQFIYESQNNIAGILFEM